MAGLAGFAFFLAGLVLKPASSDSCLFGWRKEYRGKHETQNLSPGFIARAGRWFGGWIDLKPLYRMVAVRTGRHRSNRCGSNAARQKNQKASQDLNGSGAESMEDVWHYWKEFQHSFAQI
jgi:hypothetical protein